MYCCSTSYSSSAANRCPRETCTRHLHFVNTAPPSLGRLCHNTAYHGVVPRDVKAAAIADALLIASPASTSDNSVSHATTSTAGNGDNELQQAWEVFGATLHEYRTIREQLRPWFKMFLEAHGRAPNPEDVRNTGLPRIQKLYHKYNSLRQKLFHDIPLLRQTVGPEEGQVLASKPSHAGLTPINANGPTVQEQLALSSRMSHVVNFQDAAMRKSSMSSTSVCATVAVAASVSDHAPAGVQASYSSTVGESCVPSSSAPEVQADELDADAANSSGRVKTAFLAALKYKKNKQSSSSDTPASHGSSTSSSKPGTRHLQPGEKPAVQYGSFPKNETRRARYIDEDGDSVQPLLCP